MMISTKNTLIIYLSDIEKTVVCPTLRYFYDKKGNILEEKLTELLRDIPHMVSILSTWYNRQSTGNQ